MEQKEEPVIEAQVRELAEGESSSAPVVKILIPGERTGFRTPKAERTLTRRGFLRVSLGFLGGVLAGGGLLMIDKAVRNNSSFVNSPTISDPFIQMDDYLKATATAVANKRDHDSFTESSGFTREMFESMRRGTFILEFIEEKKQVDGSVRVGSGTCWLAGIDQSEYYFVTNRHVATFFEKVSAVNMWRPNIDSVKFTPSGVLIAYNTERDLAVLRCAGNFPGVGLNDILKWQDEVSLKKGDKVLEVGFPSIFRDSKSETESTVMGSVNTISVPTDDNSHQSMAFGLAGHGGSGSPVAVLNEGKLNVVGTMFAIDYNVIEGKIQPLSMITDLTVNSLIEAVKSSGL